MCVHPPDAPKAPLTEAMAYSLLAPGKRLRPLLCLMAAQACGRDGAEALPAACAAEMVHAFSLIHDDLPCMDDDDLRRGRPTNHKVYGEATALLAGDALLADAFRVLAEGLPEAVGARCCLELASAAGSRGMTGGQALDMAGLPEGAGTAELDRIHAGKTGALITACLRMGGIVAGASAERLEALSRYGRCVGLSYQITDDLLDATGTAETAGKQVGKDAEKGKTTYPMLLGIDASRRRAEELTIEAIGALAGFGADADPLRSLAELMAGRDR